MGILAPTLVTRRRRIPSKLLICSITFFAASPLLRAQVLDKLKEAYSRNHVFELRNAMHRSPVPKFYKAAVEASANQVELAAKHLRSIIAASPHSSDADDAHDLLTNLFFRNGLYRDGLKEIESTLKERPEAEDAKNMLPLATALGAMPQMLVVSRMASKLDTEPGSTFLPLKLNGKDARFFFDTGAGISVLTESEVKELGLVAQTVNSTMGDSSGKGVTGFRVVLVNNVVIGALHLRNVPFLVLSDDGEPWNSLPRWRTGATFSTMPALTPRSRISPILEMPSPYMMSNSTCLNGGASLFFTTLTRVWLPTTSSRSLIAPMRRMSSRTEA